MNVPSADGFRFERKPGGTETCCNMGSTTGPRWTHYHDYLRQQDWRSSRNRRSGITASRRAVPKARTSTPKFRRPSHVGVSGGERRHPEEQHGRMPRSGCAVFTAVLPVALPRPGYAVWACRGSAGELPDNLEGKPVRQRTNRRCYVQPNDRGPVSRLYPPGTGGTAATLTIDCRVGRAGRRARRTTRSWSSRAIRRPMASHGFVFKPGHCGYEELRTCRFDPVRRAVAIWRGSAIACFSVDVFDVAEAAGLMRLASMAGFSARHRGGDHSRTCLCN